MSEDPPLLPPALLENLAQLAQVPQLLVATDYDGTIAPIVNDPMRAIPDRETSVALRALAMLDQTHVGIISSRALRDLAALSRLPAEIHLVGSHGSEFDVNFALQMDEETQDRRDALGEALVEICRRYPGSSLEQKPASVAFHTRNGDPESVADAMAEVETLAAADESLTYSTGKMVCEVGVMQTDKGRALETLRTNVSATAVLFVGDDTTDEDAFRTLGGPDIGVKVGEGETLAGFRIDGTPDVALLLSTLFALRSEWLAGAGLVPIEQHSLLSDQRTAAIVTPDARVTWFCAPRLDDPAIFAELLGGPTAGYFSIRNADGQGPSLQRYAGNTMMLETIWPNFTVMDYLDVSDGRPTLLAGRSDLIRHLNGSGTAIIEFAPRLDFGRFPTQIEVRTDGLEVSGARDLIVLRSPGVEWKIETAGQHQTAVARVDLSEGPLTLELRVGTASLRAEATEIRRRDHTRRFWADWADKLEIPSAANEAVRRSALVLKALVYGPSGGIAAAPTTSLPEHIGGIRNWDYRYCWLRDAALSAAALVRLGSHEEAMDYLDWVLGVLDAGDGQPERLNPLYSLDGGKLPPEADITELSGYGGSRPVRVGNAADNQVQLDVFGPIVDLVHLLGERGAPLSARHWRLVEAMVAAVELRWTEPDHGIWEIRSAPRHHVYSKVMCWVTVDRAIRIASDVFERERPEWHNLRETIASDIFENGWNDTVQSFTAAYDGTDLDASVLMVGLSGLVAPDDPRFASTVRAVEAQLREGPTVYRYHHDDGLPGAEGGFHLMTSWMIDAYAMLGEVDEAQSLFRKLLATAGETGLFAEEYDPVSCRSLGNHPQAYSHLGVINNALRLNN
ncbi:MAG: trehalose 6-phosphate phosphatase [Verrucomicrobiales bacterium]|jgi:trehalose 6-phosphate phosphatase